MNPLVKIQLSQDIFFSLQSKCSMEEIIDVLNKYGIQIVDPNDYTQKKIRKKLSNTSDEKLLLIAKHLGLEISNYIDKKGTKSRIYIKDQKKNKQDEQNQEDEEKEQLSKNSFEYASSEILKVDTILNIIMALLIPKLIFLIMKWTNENSGGAAITNLLKRISLNIGMEEGVGVFVFFGILAYKISEYTIEKYFKNRIERERIENDFLTQKILQHIESYPVSSSLRKRLKAVYVLPS